MLVGDRGDYVCMRDVAEITVPATLQAAIAARIDRLEPTAKRSLGAAAVIGSRFDIDLLRALDVEPALDLPVKAELIDQGGRQPAGRVRVSSPVDSRGGLRIAAEIGSRRAAPDAWPA